ncbi:MAG TPA: ABC transporter permease subunit [Firmicutes bacterium]|jgi:glycine betaine/proline transport system permease protein|nr:ABC transporter permease subunit [Bacillota bacterium]
MFPETLQFHIAPQIDAFVKWLVVSGDAFFTAITHGLIRVMVLVEKGLLSVPWWLWLAIIAGVIWYQSRQWRKTFLLVGLMFSIGMFGMWEPAMETLSVVITATLISLLVGIPMGVAMAEWKQASAVCTPLLDAMQTMPSFVYLIPALMLFGLGKVPAVIATIIYAVPPVVRLTELGIRQVSAAVQEAATAFGATRWQMLKEVRLPLAMPSILAGVNQTTMMALAMVVIASMIGAGGVGEKVLFAINHIAVGNGFEAGFAIVALAIIIDRMTQGVAQRWKTDGSSH